MSVPNQKRIRIGERVKRNKDHLYAMMNLDALKEAMRILKGSSLKLWLYFNKNQDKYEFELSRVDCQEWGIKKDSYYSAIKDLIDKGYLVQMRDGSNIYVFCETANSINKNDCVSENKIQDWENQKDGSEIKIQKSENQERNNKNNTEIIQENTLNDLDYEIFMYSVLDKLCARINFKDDDGEKIGDLLQNDYYWDDPKTRIEQMNSDERRELETYFRKYSDYMYFL